MCAIANSFLLKAASAIEEDEGGLVIEVAEVAEHQEVVLAGDVEERWEVEEVPKVVRRQSSYVQPMIVYIDEGRI